jgi:NUMOD4 motif/HNH endonuclease
MDDATAERWLPVAGYEGLYEVSDLGRVRSVRRSSTSGRILKPWTDSNGRRCVKLSKGSVEKTKRIHQLEARAFLGPCPEGHETRHLDDDHGNDVLSNLAYGTSTQNKDDMVRNGRHYEAARTHCDHGHEYTRASTRIRVRNGRESRECRICAADADTRTRSARSAAQVRCKVGDCDKPVMGRGMCSMHYGRSRDGRPLDGSKPCPTCGRMFIPLENRRDNARIYCSLECAPAR